MKVVFDSNILILALVFPGGKGEQALLDVIHGPDELILSRPIIDQTLTVLSRKFARDREQLARVAIFLTDLARVVRCSKKLSALADEPDNRILETALAGKADVIVTGDKAMLELAEFEGVSILSLADYLGQRLPR